MTLPPRPNLTTKVVCLMVLIGALSVLREVEETDRSTKTRWAVWKALRKHPPSLRIFRSLLEWNLVLWGTVVSLTIWYRYVGRSMVAELIFLPPSIVGHIDSNDAERGYRDSSKIRSSTYSGLRFVDPEESESFQSEIMFVDPDDSMTSLQTGTGFHDEDNNNDNDDTLFVMHKGQPYFDDSTHGSKKTTKEDSIPKGGGGGGEVELSEGGTKTKEREEDDDDDDDVVSETLGSGYDVQEEALSSSSLLSYAPSVSMTASAALDMLVPILIALFLFTLLSTQEMKHRLPPKLTWIAAPIIPLVLVIYLITSQLLRPWQSRKQFFIVIGWTMGAPIYPVTFRDGFIGDIFTSTVRPLQDTAFTFCYILSGLQGYWSDGYDGFWDNLEHNPHHLNDDDDAVVATATTEAPQSSSSSLLKLPPLETSWFLHTVLLPMCMVSPLWWRFLQNLRQSHDTQKRWPYLGNAFKYLLAAEVAMFGVFDPSKQETYLWLGWFVVATLYQVWWDVWMDWDLLVPAQQQSTSTPRGRSYDNDDINNNSNSGWGSWSSFFPYRLRSKRLYPQKSFYWTILIVNFLLRFCWTLSFLPPRYLNQAGVLSDTFQHSDWSRALAPAIASAEIIRRTLWGLLRLENEAIKVAAQHQQPPTQELSTQRILELQTLKGQDPEEAFGDPLDGMMMEPMGISMMLSDHRLHGGSGGIQRWNVNKNQGIIPALLENWKTMEGNSEISILAELACWATVFATVGMIAAAHRMTL